MKRWPLRKTYFWERIPFFRLLLPLVAGIILYPDNLSLRNNFMPVVSAGVLFLGVVYFFTVTKKQVSSVYKAVTFAALYGVLILIAWMLCYLHDVRTDPYWFAHQLKSADAWMVEVTAPPVEKEHTWKLEVNVTGSMHGDTVYPVRGKAYVYAYKYGTPAVREGDVLAVTGEWQRIKNRGNPFELDYAAYSARRNIYYVQFAGGNDMSVLHYATPGDLSLIRRVHLWCMRQLEWYIKDRGTLGLMKAMLIGDKDLLDDDLTDAYADTGVVHIMAISGAHITVFFLLVAFLLGWIKHKKYHWVKYIAALPLIWLYVVVAGAPASALRAATMFSLLGIGMALRKHPNGINQLLVTAFILLCINPMWLYAVGFQLSFLAVLSIFIFYRPVYRLLSPVNKVVRSIWSAVAVSIAAEILVAPLVIYYFNLFPLQFIIANLLAYFFMGVILVAGMLLIALSFSYPVAHLIGNGIEWLVTLFNKMIFALQHVNPGILRRLTLTDLQLVWWYVLIIGVAVWAINKKKAGLIVSVAGLCLFLLSSCLHQWWLTHHEALVVYNAGKENYIELVQGKKAVWLSRPEKEEPKTNKYVLRPARIYWQVGQEDSTITGSSLINVNGYRVFMMDRMIEDTAIHADYVVLNYHAKPKDIPVIKAVFHPEMIVIGTNVTRKRAKQLEEKVEELGMAAYNVYNGAFIR